MKHEESRKRNSEAVASYLCGESKKSICARLGIREGYFYCLCNKKGIKVKTEKIISERDIAIGKEFKDGATLEDIGKKYGLSISSIRGINKAQGLTYKQGSKYMLRKTKKEIADVRWKDKEAMQNNKCIAIYGCTNDELINHNEGKNKSNRQSKAKKYFHQKMNAKRRGIEFNLTFPQWVDIWDKSGLYDARSRGKDGYCMSRYGDSGAYEVGNVYIASVIENSRDGGKVAQKNMKRDGISNSTTGTGKGWSFKRGRYVVQFRGKTIGSYATQFQAEECYQHSASVWRSTLLSNKQPC